MADPAPKRGGGVLSQLLAAGVGFLTWVFSDKLRAAVAVGLVVAVVAGNWAWTNRPISRDQVCDQARELAVALDSSSTGSDNSTFKLANSLGASAAHADSGAGGNIDSVHRAGDQLATLGQGKGFVQYASYADFAGPLSTIQTWCNATLTASAAAPVDQAPVDTAAAGSPADPGTDPESDAPQVDSVPAAVPCPSMNDAVLGIAGGGFVYSGQVGFGVADRPAGLNLYNGCTYDLSNATSSEPPLLVSLYDFDNDDNAIGLLSSLALSDPGSGSVSTVTFDGHPTAVARIGSAVSMVVASSPTSLTNDQLSEIASASVKYLRPA